MMVDGRWVAGDDLCATREDGAFVRAETRFHHRIGDPDFPAEAGRYHLYVSLACPWAHRTLIMRRIKGLARLVPVHVVHPHMLEDGWEFRPDPEPLYGLRHLRELYARADPCYTGRVSVPCLWDAGRQTIVCNESSEIVRMFNTAFDALTGNREDCYPEALRAEIDTINAFVQQQVNNGVYRCGFATTQAAYDEAFDTLFAALDQLETRLADRPFLAGERLTEADIRLFPTLIRFDAVYHGHFKCNRNRIADMPRLRGWLNRLWRMPAFRDTTDFHHIKQHYYVSHPSINPTRIVPKGPRMESDDPTSPYPPGPPPATGANTA